MNYERHIIDNVVQYDSPTKGLGECVSGWLSPQGDFIYCAYATHKITARDIIHYNDHLLTSFMEDRRSDGNSVYEQCEADFLAYMGYVMLTCPRKNGKQVILHGKQGFSGIQKVELTKLFTNRGDFESVKYIVNY